MNINLLAIRGIELIANVYNENSELIGVLEIGDENVFNGGFCGIYGVNEYRCEDFFSCSLGNHTNLIAFFDALDDFMSLEGVQSFKYALENSTTWAGCYLQATRDFFNDGASSLFFDNGALDQLKGGYNKDDFIKTYLKISQALNFVGDGLIQFTQNEIF
jgi:hypothetical protein